MKILSTISGVLLGGLFVIFGVDHFFEFIPKPSGAMPPEGSPPAMFFGAIASTGFLSFVKACEILGGVLVLIPKTRNFGLLALGPIILNILAFHIFIGSPAKLLDPVVIAVSLLAAFLLFDGRKKFAGLLN